MEEVSALRLQVEALKQMIKSEIKREVETAVTNFRLRNGKKKEERQTGLLQTQRELRKARPSKETEKEREYRLRNNREKHKKYLSKLTEEARFLRLQKKRERNKKFLSKETEEARLLRRQKINQKKKLLRKNPDFVTDENRTKSKDESSVCLCPMCNKKCHGRRGLKIHMAWHSSKKDFKCRNCGQNFENLEVLLDHCQVVHAKEIPNQTQKKRNEKTKNKIPKMLEVEKRQKRKIYKCEICLEEFGTILRFNYHVVSHEKETFKDLESFLYSCGLCGKTFGKMYSLFQHQIHHPPDNDFNCLVCGQQSEDLDSLCIHHHKEHTEISDNMLQMLIKVVERRKNKIPREVFECGQCPRRFWDYRIYADHLLVHLQEAEGSSLAFHCPLCENKCDSIWKTLLHLTDHPSSANSKCKKCGESFADLNLLTVHFYNQHFEAAESVLKFLQNVVTDALGFGSDPSRQTFRPLSCKSCGLKCAYSRQLASHKYHVHKLDRPFQCESCGKQQLKIKTDVLLLQQLKIRFRKALESNSTSNCTEVIQEMENTTTDHHEFVSNDNPNVNLSDVWTRDQNIKQDNISVTKVVPKEMDQSNFTINYVDFSRANVPEESLKHEIAPSTEISDNCNSNGILQSEVAEDINMMVVPETSLMDDLSNEAFSDDIYYSDDHNDDFNDVEDVKPIILNGKAFPDDPFSPKLIVQLKKLKEFNCGLCHVVLYTEKHFKVHKNSRSHRSELRQHLAEGTKIKEENGMENIKSKGRKLLHHKANRKRHEYKDYQSCLLCTAKFRTTQALKRHYVSRHNGENILKCQLCVQTFLQDDLLQSHLKIFHKKEECEKQKKIYVCGVCQETFTSSRDFKDHSMSHKKCKYKCVICQVLSDTQNDLEQHYSVAHQDEMPFKCGECNDGFPTISRLELHKENVHGKNEMTSDKRKGHYACEQCGKMYRLRSMLMAHVLRHDQKAERQFICDFCPRSFTSESSLSTHMRTHTGEKPYFCNQCQMGFFSSQQLRNHNYTSHLDRKHVCEICGKSFTKNNILTVHLRTHTGETPYPCKQCDRSFVSSSHLKTHVDQVHLGITYVCDACGSTFNDIRNLRKHRKRHNGVKVRCDLCPKEYAALQDLQIHIDKVHLKLPVSKRDVRRPTFVCSVCSQKFRSEEALTRHNELHNPNRPFGCELCTWRFKFYSNLVFHRKNVHEKQGIDYWSKTRRARKANKAAQNEISDNTPV